jgi:beta-glucanase (GH16 family)
MKKNFFLAVCLCTTIFSCQKIQSIDESLLNQNGIDPETPKNAKPFIIEENNSNSGVITEGVPTVISDYSQYSLKWSDEFDGTSLNSSKWASQYTYKYVTNRHPDLNHLYQIHGNVSVSNGSLKLKSTKTTNNSLSGACVTGQGLKYFQYGYFEARMYIMRPSTSASQSSFWLMYDDNGVRDGSPNDGCEVDVFESSWTGNRMQSNLHWDGYGSDKGGASSPLWTANGSVDGYHLYGLLWRNDLLRVYYDGVAQVSFSGYANVPQAAEYLKLSTNAAFGDAKDAYPTRPLNTEYVTYVDYVRVYQK